MKKRTWNSSVSGVILVILAGICWGLISIFIRRLTAAGFSSLQIVVIRSFGSAVLLLLGILLRDPALLKIRLCDVWMFLGTGIVSTAFFTYCYFSSITRSGAAVAVVLLYTSPVFVILLSAVFFHESITKRKIIAILLTFCGCVLVAGLLGSSTTLTAGALLLGLGSGFGYALYSLFAGFAIRRYSPVTVTFYTVLFCGSAMLFLVDGRETLGLLTQNRGSVWYPALGISLLCTVIPYVFYTSGLRFMDAGRAAVLVTVEPIVGALIGIVFFHEVFTPAKIIGVLLVFSAVVIAGMPEKKHTMHQ